MKEILIVEDEPSLGFNLLAYLEDEQFSAIIATSGNKALQYLKERKITVAVVNMRLPDMNGNSFIEKAHQLKPNLRFLIYTGLSDYALTPALLDMGITPDCVFYKPLLDMGPLIARLKMVANTH